MALGGVILEALGAPVTLVDQPPLHGARLPRGRRGKDSGADRRTAAVVATPQIMPLDLVAWALFRRGRSAEEVAEQTGLELEEALEAIIRGFRLTLEDG
jgi:hypothetical protein